MTTTPPTRSGESFSIEDSDDIFGIARQLIDGRHFGVLTTVDGDGVNPITTLDSFKTYVAGVRERCAQPPHQANDITVVGNYRMID